MNNKPQSVIDYLSKVEGTPIAAGYLCLNKENKLIKSAGALGSINLTDLDYSQALTLLIPELEGLIPWHNEGITVIQNVAVDNHHYFDMHFFTDGAGSWLVFIDETRSGTRQQEEQQVRLDIDFANDKRGTGT